MAVKFATFGNKELGLLENIFVNWKAASWKQTRGKHFTHVHNHQLEKKWPVYLQRRPQEAGNRPRHVHGCCYQVSSDVGIRIFVVDTGNGIQSDWWQGNPRSCCGCRHVVFFFNYQIRRNGRKLSRGNHSCWRSCCSAFARRSYQHALVCVDEVLKAFDLRKVQRLAVAWILLQRLQLVDQFFNVFLWQLIRADFWSGSDYRCNMSRKVRQQFVIRRTTGRGLRSGLLSWRLRLWWKCV